MATTDPAERPAEPLFPQLSGGPSRLSPEEVARHQRERLELAMVEAVARHGFAGTTLRELVALAGVSKSTFYEHFESKEECFLATYDRLIGRWATAIREAYDAPAEPQAKQRAAVAQLMTMVIEEPDVASFVSVDSLTIGGVAVSHRERAWDTFEQMARAASGAEGDAGAGTVARAVIAGFGGVVYRRLRSGRIDELPGLVDPLLEWALSYGRPDTEAMIRAAAAARVPAAPPPVDPEQAEKPGWEEPPDSRLSRSTLSQRERIIRGAARVVVEKDYAALSIPAISAAAGTSNQTFYENFSSKREALLAAYEIVAADALAIALAAFKAAGDGPEAIGAALRALLEHIAGHPMFARLAFFELATAGPTAPGVRRLAAEAHYAALRRGRIAGSPPC